MITSYPICLFLYNRPKLVIPCLDAISKSAKGHSIHLYIFVDGPKSEEDSFQVKDTLKKVNNYDFQSFDKVQIEETPKNKGLANSIIHGATKVIEKYKKIIVIEDDLIVSNNFVSFMIEALMKYKENKKIGSISGFSFAIKSTSNDDVYFHPRPNSWGWATWEDRWKSVNWNVNEKYLNEISYSKKSFNMLGQDMDRMLKAYVYKKIDSWAIRWALCHWKYNWLALTPYKSKIINKGFGNNLATNTKSTNNFLIIFDESKQFKDFKYPSEVKATERNIKIVNKFNSNLIRFLQNYLPNKLWNYINQKIFKYY